MSKEKYVEAKLWDPDVDPVYTAKKSGGMGVMMGVTAVVVVVAVVTIVLFGPFGNDREPVTDVYDPNMTTTEPSEDPPPWQFPLPDPNQPGHETPGFTPPVGNDAASADMERGIALYLGGQYQAAIGQFGQVLQSGAGDPVNALIYRGRSFIGIENFHAAISDFTQAHRRQPNNAEVLALRGGSYFRQGFHIEAIADLTRAIELDGNNISAREYRARTHEAMGQHALAQADFNVAAVLRQQQAMGGTPPQHPPQQSLHTQPPMPPPEEMFPGQPPPPPPPEQGIGGGGAQWR